MTLTPGERKLYGMSGMVWLTQKEREEIEEFHKQFGGQFLIMEKPSSHSPDRYKEDPNNTAEDPSDDGYPAEEDG